MTESQFDHRSIEARIPLAAVLAVASNLAARSELWQERTGLTDFHRCSIAPPSTDAQLEASGVGVVDPAGSENLPRQRDHYSSMTTERVLFQLSHYREAETSSFFELLLGNVVQGIEVGGLSSAA